MDRDNLVERKEELTNIIKKLRREKKDKLEKTKRIHKNIELFYRISILFEMFLFITSVVNWSWSALITIFSIDILGDIYYIVKSKCINKKYDDKLKEKQLELDKITNNMPEIKESEKREKEKSKNPHTYSFQPNSKSILQNNDYKIKNNQGKKYIKRR